MRAICGAFHKDGNKTRDTGTAVTTIKDCNADIPPEPIEISNAAITPIITPQNTRKELCGESVPVITIDTENVIESPVVATKIVVNIKNKNDIIQPNGNCSVIASNAAGKLKPVKGSEITPGVANSNAKPLPPTIVNQKQVITGATTEIVNII